MKMELWKENSENCENGIIYGRKNQQIVKMELWNKNQQIVKMEFCNEKLGN